MTEKLSALLRQLSQRAGDEDFARLMADVRGEIAQIKAELLKLEGEARALRLTKLREQAKRSRAELRIEIVESVAQSLAPLAKNSGAGNVSQPPELNE